MGLLDPGSSHPLARRQRLELAGGFVGFFALIALVNAVGLIATGRPSALASIILLALIALGLVVWRAWKRADSAFKNGGKQ